MGIVPPKPPPLFGTDAEKRAQLIRYRDHLLELQRHQMDAAPWWFTVAVGWVVLLAVAWLVSTL